MARIGIGPATVETTSARLLYQQLADELVGKSVDPVGRQGSNAPRAIPGESCLRMRVCAGGSDVGRKGIHNP